jgi:serine/threonine-protein kinase
MAEQRYRVIDRLEAGGMAEVFRGEAVSVQGFKKQVAIKRVLPHLAQNKSFIRMFIDEARLGARLNHANIVTVFDIGAADNTYFIVMEFVDGANLKTILETLKKLGRRPGVKEMLQIAMDVCKGLSYAHELRDDDGKPFNIVHRDISPPNILITKGGEVKVTDFGLAKATTQLEKTDPGVVKGKFSYLSPEAAMGQSVDARADLFAVGIVIWEALAGRRLFLGESDYETVKRVQQAQVPSLTQFNSDVDAELDRLVMKAMARDRDQRFLTARDMNDAIAEYLFRHQMKVTSYDVGNLVQAVVSSRGKERERKADTSIIDQLIQEELLAFTSLDEMNDPLGPASAQSVPPEVSMKGVPPRLGASPLDAGSFNEKFENPSEWFAEEEEQATAFFDRKSLEPGELTRGKSDPTELAALLEREDEAAAAAGKGAVATRSVPQLAPDGSDQDLVKMLERELATVGGPSIERVDISDLGQRKTSLQPQGGAAAAGAAPVVKKSGGGMKYIVLGLVILLGAGAAAWFGHLIPH